MAHVLATKLREKNVPQALFSGDPIEIDDTYEDICNPINCKGAESIFLWIEYTAGTSVESMIKANVGLTADALDYELPIQTISSSEVSLEGEAVVLPAGDSNIIYEVKLNVGIPFIKFKIKDSADGSGQITSASITFK